MKKYITFVLLLVFFATMFFGCHPAGEGGATVAATDTRQATEESPPAESPPSTATSETAITTSEDPTNYEPSETGNTTVGESAHESTEPNTEETTEAGTAEPTPTEPKPTEPKPTEPKPTEPKPTEPKPTEPKPTNPSNPACSGWEDHVWSDWIQKKAPTSCSADGCGEDVIICTKCGYVAQTANPTLPHSWGGWTQTKAPTCGAEGAEARSCSRCGQTETRTLAAIGTHSWNETAPTCTEAGSKTCKVCGKTESGSAALGHDWVHHDAERHCVWKYTCYCGAAFFDYDEYDAHFEYYLNLLREGQLTEEENCHGGYECHQEWIEDKPAYRECSRCRIVEYY